MTTRTIPPLQSRTMRDPFDRGLSGEVTIYPQGPRAHMPEHVTLEVRAGGSTFTLTMNTDDAAWLGHTLLSAQDDALRMGYGGDYDQHDDHRAIYREEELDAMNRNSIMDPWD